MSEGDLGGARYRCLIVARDLAKYRDRDSNITLAALASDAGSEFRETRLLPGLMHAAAFCRALVPWTVRAIPRPV